MESGNVILKKLQRHVSGHRFVNCNIIILGELNKYVP